MLNVVCNTPQDCCDWTGDTCHINTLTLALMSSHCENVIFLISDITEPHVRPDIMLLPLSFINSIEGNWSV